MVYHLVGYRLRVIRSQVRGLVVWVVLLSFVKYILQEVENSLFELHKPVFSAIFYLIQTSKHP